MDARDVQPEHDCDLCADTGSITWQQPVHGENGALVLTEMSHPCVNGCSGWYRLPTAESGNVINPASDGPAAGNVADPNQHYRAHRLVPARFESRSGCGRPVLRRTDHAGFGSAPEGYRMAPDTCMCTRQAAFGRTGRLRRGES